jgi:hypothetical protein
MSKMKVTWYDYDTRKGEKRHKVVAESTFAGKKVRGVAKCAPGDEYDPDIGMNLATLRCNLKIAAKRLARAEQKKYEAYDAFADAAQHYDAMSNYWSDAVQDYNNAAAQLAELENSLKKE